MSAQNDARNEKSPKKSSNVGRTFDAAFRGFVNVELTEVEKREFDAWFELGGGWDVMETAAADGIALSVKWSDKEKCFLASATQRRSDSPNAGLVVTARGKTTAKAWGRVLFILVKLSGKPAWEATKAVADDDRW